MEPKEQGEEGYVKVRVPMPAEAMVKGIIAAGDELIKAIGEPLAEQSLETMASFARTMATSEGVTEMEEAGVRQAFGNLTTVARSIKGEPDPALQDLRSGMG